MHALFFVVFLFFSGCSLSFSVQLPVLSTLVFLKAAENLTLGIKIAKLCVCVQRDLDSVQSFLTVSSIT